MIHYSDSIVHTRDTRLFLDALTSFLEESKTSSEIITKFQDYIENEQYETECIQIDIEENIGNISREITDKRIMARINQFVISNRSMLSQCIILITNRWTHFQSEQRRFRSGTHFIIGIIINQLNTISKESMIHLRMN